MGFFDKYTNYNDQAGMSSVYLVQTDPYLRLNLMKCRR